MQKTMGHGKTKMDKMARRRALPCVRDSRALNRGQVVHSTMLMSMERKSVQEAKKKQIFFVFEGSAELQSLFTAVQVLQRK
jgi:hypothetical protein